MFYLICYDIVDDRRRNKVAKLLELYGWRVQKSVYERLQKYLLKLLNPIEDQLRFYPLSKRSRNKVLVLGFKPEFKIDDSAFIV